MEEKPRMTKEEILRLIGPYLDDELGNRARWPAKILDYLSAGRAVVTNDVGEAGELFREREVGVLSGPSEEEMADGIVPLLENPTAARSLAESARRVMVQEWDWKLRGDGIASVVES